MPHSSSSYELLFEFGDFQLELILGFCLVFASFCLECFQFVRSFVQLSFEGFILSFEMSVCFRYLVLRFLQEFDACL